MAIAEDLLAQLEAFASVGGLPETARNQLSRFMVRFHLIFVELLLLLLATFYSIAINCNL